MSQDLINDLTDRVSSLTADLTSMTRLWEQNRVVINRVESELASLKQIDAVRRQTIAQFVGLADTYAKTIAETRTEIADLRGVMGEVEAERVALADELRHMIWTHDDNAGHVEAALQVQDIIDNARAEYRAKRKAQ